MVGDGFENDARSFDDVIACAIGGGNDRAFLYDSAGNDRFYGTATRSWMVGDGFRNDARGFDNVFAYANAGGNDRAAFYDVGADDAFRVSGSVAAFTGSASSLTADGFDAVTAHSKEDETAHADVSAADFVFEQLGNWD